MSSLSEVILAILQQRSVATVLEMIVQKIATDPSIATTSDTELDLALVRIWLVGPGDICDSCHFRAECTDQTSCL
ncbi:MAG TPA: hypothetical protein PK156_49140, partial [Polyangium sp.]|nr:hypothetical protein [Polyangium sp.]